MEVKKTEYGHVFSTSFNKYCVLHIDVGKHGTVESVFMQTISTQQGAQTNIVDIKTLTNLKDAREVIDAAITQAEGNLVANELKATEERIPKGDPGTKRATKRAAAATLGGAGVLSKNLIEQEIDKRLKFRTFNDDD